MATPAAGIAIVTMQFWSIAGMVNCSVGDRLLFSGSHYFIHCLICQCVSSVSIE
ncbi:hypothetical protein LC609_29075 [Nostoc sp. XA013]|nr:hypothetical protein [Nostoc sp. XA013]